MARASYDAPVLPDGRRLGAHLPLANGMAKAVERAHEIGATALQVFGDNPTAWRRRAEPPAELPAFRERLAARDIGPVAIHASYLINLAGPELDFYERSVGLVTSELRAAPGFEARYVNVHIGSHRDTSVAAGTGRLADAVARILADVDDGADAARLVLENSSGGGFGLGTNVAELGDIAEAIAARGVADRRVGFCLDTAHAWGAGVDLSKPNEVDGFLAAFDGRIGLERLVMVHLNDSKSERGSRADRHEHLGAGRIGAAGLARILTHPGLAGTTYYLETPGMDEGYDAVNVARAYDIAAGRPLPDLPPEAMSMRGSRARTGPPEAAGAGPARTGVGS
jgi:deoxyribonuclease IV